MKVIITGGGGFLGSQLSEKLLERGAITGPSGVAEKIGEIVLLDAVFHRPATDPRVRQITGDISDRDTVFSAIGSDAGTAIFHLASMVSGECEERFDDALRVNLDGGRNIFEAARAAAGRPRVVFASSIACFGGEAMQNPNTDRTKLTPQTTYGMTKAICELLVNDHSRKGHFDGRSARLPTVIVRPGKPNAAASSWASGMFREPLNGETCLLPVRRDQCHPMTGYRTVIESLIALHEVPAERLSDDRAIGLPAHRVTPQLAESVIREIAQERGLKLGPIVDAFDARIQGIVDNWPVAVDGARAIALGLPQPPPLKQIVEQYLEDFDIGGPPDDAERDPIRENAGAPTVLVFVHTVERSLVPLLRVIDQYGVERRERIKTEVVFLAADRLGGEQRVRAVNGSLKLKARVGLSPDGAEGPGNFGLNKECMMTIVMAKDNVVTANFALVQPGIADAPKVIAALAKTCGDLEPPNVEALTAKQPGNAREQETVKRPPLKMP